MKTIKLAPLSLFLFIPIAFADSGIDEQNPEQRFIIDIPRSPLSTQESAEKYWTEERIRAAKPKRIVLSAEEASRMETEARFKSSMLNNEEKEKTLVIESSPGGDGSPIPKGVKGVVEEADVDQYPFSNAGILYFTEANGVDNACTAEFVGSNRVLMTAAHCLVDDNGKWYKNIVFHPRSRGKNRIEILKTACKGVPDGAVTQTGRDLRKDYGFITTYKKNPSWLGLRSGVPYTEWAAIGYPINYGNALYLQRVYGFKGTTFSGVSDGIVEMKDNPMENGSSGGAWIGKLNNSKKPRGNYVIGLNSFFFGDGSTFSPYFNKDVFDLLDKVKQACNIE